MKRRTKISIETDRTLVIRNRKTMNAASWCANCSTKSPMISVDAAAVLARVSSRTIYRWVEAGRLHFTETPEGLLLVCPSSFPKDGTVKLPSLRSLKE